MKLPSVFENKNFIKLWISQAASVVSTAIINYVLLLRLFQTTNSTLTITFLWIAYSLPALMIGPLAATVVDYFDRKTLLAATNLLQSITILLLIPTLNKHFLVYGVVFLYSFLNQFYLPAESASLPNVVKTKQLPEANGFFYLTRQISTLFGVGLAGILFKFFKTKASLFFSSGLLLVAFISVLLLPKLYTKEKTNFEKSISDFFNDVLEGYRFIKSKKEVLYPLLMLAGIEIISTIIAINVPAMAKEIFGLPLDDAVILVIIPAALGAVAGAFIVPKFLGKRIRKITMIENSIITLSISMFLLAVLIINLPIIFRILIIPVLSFCTGFSYVGINIPTQTYLQEITPKEMLGRLFGNLWFIITLATITPLIFSASITEYLGVRLLFLLISVIAFITFIYLKRSKIKFQS